MIIKKLKLKNIRSYEDQEVVFPEGITLLSGDIGSGKTTILMAAEFALFGFIRNDLSGYSLLRNGKDSGYVTIYLEIKNKNISIKRTLKKNNLAISQDQCFITIDDITKELTPNELKQRVYEILNYPYETISKKSMIYRYTVYTPQEDMKTILLGDKELRLETIRKVFSIDKYKRIKENSKILSLEIKNKKKESAAYIYDLEDKKIKYLENENKIKEHNKKILDVELEIKNNVIDIENAKNEIILIENNIQKINSLKKDFEVVSSRINIKSADKEKNSKNIASISTDINNNYEIKEINIENIKKNIIEMNLLLEKKEIELKNASKLLIEIKSNIINSEDIKNKIKIIDLCPLCEQQVSHEHKKIISEREDSKINLLKEKFELYFKNEKLIEDEIKNAKLILEKLKSEEKEHEINKIKVENIKYKKQLHEKLLEEINLIDLDILNMNSKKNEIIFEIDSFKNIEENYKNFKINLEKLQIKNKNLEIQKSVLNSELNMAKELNLSLFKEIAEKEKIREKLNYYIEIHDWIDSIFTSLIETIERKIMLNLHSNFNSLFNNWFSMLMDTENIKIKLDEEFTPIINQNGYDLEYENLSGGEKTACALAYRLALNQAINNLVLEMATNDLIILDEPTDGFSSEQLDRLRNVLNELKMKQIIIVSHENKIESFADNIIRIVKEGHVSNVFI